jgi:hypothetical protein
VAGAFVVLAWSTAQAQPVPEPSNNTTAIPDPNAPPATPAPAAAPAPDAGSATLGTPAPPADDAAPPFNVNPAPPSPPPIKSPPDNNTAAQTNAVMENSVQVPPMPTMGWGKPYPDHGTMYRPGYNGLPGFGWAAFVGGGFVDFTDSNLRSMTGGGGGWDARVVGGTRSYIGLEAAYVGSARSIDALGLAANSALVSNGFDGNLRVNIPIFKSASLIEPFGFVGLGYSRYSVTNYNNTVTSDVTSSDNIMTLPFGAGFAYGYRGFIADARFTYTSTFYNDLVRNMDRTGALNTWGVGGNVGVSF